MLKKLNLSSRFTFILKCLLISYLITTGLLLLLALMLYRFGLSEKVVSICIIAIYILVTFLAGFLARKREGTRKLIYSTLTMLRQWNVGGNGELTLVFPNLNSVSKSHPQK